MVRVAPVTAENLLTECTGTVDRQVETPPFEIQVHAHGIVRMRVSDLHNVILVIDSVAVLIDPDHVSRFGIIVTAFVHEGVTLFMVCIDLGLVLEDSFTGNADEVADRISRSRLEGRVSVNRLGKDIVRSINDSFAVVDVEHFVFVVSAVDTDAVEQIACFGGPVETELQTGVADRTAIDGRGARPVGG